MARSFLTAINLNKNELLNARVQNVALPTPSPGTDKGLIAFDNADNTLKWWDGNQWIAAKAAAGATPAATVTTQAVGDAPVVGVSTNFAREDHKHGREAFGAAVSLQTSFGLIGGVGVNTTLARSDHYHGTPAHSAAEHATIPLSALAPPVADINMNTFRLTNLTNPSTNQDAVTKIYVDNLIAGLTWKNPVDVASTANVALTGTPTIDGIATSLFNRVLLKNQTAPAENGIWTVNSGAWTRVTDADSGVELINAAVFVKRGTANADTSWVCTNDAPLTIDTTAIIWVQFAGGGTVVAGNGLTQSGNTLNVASANAGIVVGADDIQLGWAGSGVGYGSTVTPARSDHDHDARYAQSTRTITTTAPLTGGGNLASDRTLAITSFAGSAAGAVPVSTGGAVNFLRADGTWSPPSLDTTAGDARYVNVIGDTMTDTLTITKNLGVGLAVPASTVSARTFIATGTGGGLQSTDGGYVSLSGSGANLSVSGGFSTVDFTGISEPLHLPNLAPAVATDATTKQYVDGAVATKATKFVQAFGDGTATSYVITHNLGSSTVMVQVQRVVSPYDTVECDIEHTSSNTVTLRFAVAPSSVQYNVVVVG